MDENTSTRCVKAERRDTEYAMAWKNQGREMILMTNIKLGATGFPASNQINATPACIIAHGETVPRKLCTSGWRPQQALYNILNNQVWTNLVREFSAATGFDLRAHVRDVQKNTNDPDLKKKNKGLFFACHAEKKLGLYFLTQAMKLAGVSLSDALNGRLRSMNLPLCHMRALVILGHKPCKSCLRFLQFIKKRTGIDVRTKSCPVFTEYIKKRTFYDNQDAPRGAAVAERIATDEDADSNKPDDENDSAKTHKGDGTDEAEESDAGSVVELHPPMPHANVQADDAISVPDDDVEAEDGQTNPRRFATPIDRMSVRSTPSPSVPASLQGLSPLPRRLRFSTYSSPPRSGGSAAPPSIWGGRSKPPATPCLVAPNAWRALSGSSSSGRSQTGSPRDNQVSYFFESDSQASDRHEPLPSQHLWPLQQTQQPEDPDVEFLRSRTTAPQHSASRLDRECFVGDHTGNSTLQNSPLSRVPMLAHRSHPGRSSNSNSNRNNIRLYAPPLARTPVIDLTGPSMPSSGRGWRPSSLSPTREEPDNRPARAAPVRQRPAARQARLGVANRLNRTVNRRPNPVTATHVPPYIRYRPTAYDRPRAFPDLASYLYSNEGV